MQSTIKYVKLGDIANALRAIAAAGSAGDEQRQKVVRGTLEAVGFAFGLEPVCAGQIDPDALPLEGLAWVEARE